MMRGLSAVNASALPVALALMAACLAVLLLPAAVVARPLSTQTPKGRLLPAMKGRLWTPTGVLRSPGDLLSNTTPTPADPRFHSVTLHWAKMPWSRMAAASLQSVGQSIGSTWGPLLLSGGGFIHQVWTAAEESAAKFLQPGKALEVSASKEAAGTEPPLDGGEEEFEYQQPITVAPHAVVMGKGRTPGLERSSEPLLDGGEEQMMQEHESSMDEGMSGGWGVGLGIGEMQGRVHEMLMSEDIDADVDEVLAALH